MKDFRLRPIREEDKQRILAWRNHAEVRAVMLTDHLISEAEHEAWWQRVAQQQDVIRLIVEQDLQPVAFVNFYQINRRNRQAWWGFYIDNAGVVGHQARLALFSAIEQLVLDYAQHELDLVELYCEMLEDNQVAIAMHARAGFEVCAAPSDARVTDKTVVYMRKRFVENLARRAYFLCRYHPENLLLAYEAQLKAYPRLNYRVERVAFAQYPMVLNDAAHPIHQREDDMLVFCERLEDLVEETAITADGTYLEQASAALTRYLDLIRHAIETQPGREIYVFDFAWIKPRHLTLTQSSAIHDDAVLRSLNQQLYDACAKLGVVCFPYAQCVQSFGVESAFSNKYWYLARMPFSSGFAEHLATRLVATQLAQQGLNARVLVLDLDNTLWRGVIGDDGLSGIQLGGDYPGNVYKDLQRLFKSLSQKGFLLTLCSKNTPEVALEAMNQHPEMLLRESDFVAMQINWQSKADNIKALADTLNLGLSSFCFIDDNPLERAEVRQALPEVMVPELPTDPADWVAYLCRLPVLALVEVNDTDRKRQALYQQRAQMQQAQVAQVDKGAFIKSLQIEVSLQTMSAASFARCLQLFSKTNQFNTTTRRYTSAQLKAFARSADTQVWYVASRDKYSPEYEGVAALVVSVQGDQWCIDNFVMSCRVMGRSIEQAVINRLASLAEQQGVRRLCGRFIASERNQPVADLYAGLGFERQAQTDVWCCNLPLKIREDMGIEVELMQAKEEWGDV
ncbi:MAG: UDP-4-amino-4,6-dideoxy-N-acetyl-beta-L-altrosamine N-acetyltransferase [Thiomicrospira sp.]